MIVVDRDFGDEDDFDDEFDWIDNDPEEFVISEESWDELQRKILEDEEFEHDE
jgi:hypothetical protein